MKTFGFLFIILAFLLLISTASAQTAAQVLTLAVNSTSLFTVSGNPAAMTISTATAGQNQLVSVVENSTTYSVTHNSSTPKRITAAMDVNLPTGITLQVSLASGKGVSDGLTTLSTTTVEVVNGIVHGADKNNVITYTFSALASAGDLPGTTRNIIFTLTN